MPRRDAKLHRQIQKADKPYRRVLLIGIGVISVGLGVVGILVPLLPTTPFLLLAAACFIRSSRTLHHWLVNHPWFGSYIRHYQQHRAVSLRAKITALAFLWLTIGYSAIAVVQSWGMRALLVAIAVGVTAHLLHLKTLTPEMLGELERAATTQHARLPESPGEARPDDGAS